MNSSKRRLTTDVSESTLNGGLEIEFKNLRFSVPNKVILNNICGNCKPGRILAILGQSGAGKSTFLDVLACNPTPGGKVEGEVFVNGALRHPVSFRKATCYVMQRDVLQSSATVRESIVTAALLKLPKSMARKDKEARVDKILEELGLVDCQNTLIGDELLGMKGVSGGQKRRVSIGIELVKEPQAIFLDEPTSGLDSEMAAAIMDTLHNLAKRNRTIALTIHQPNSLLTSKFDDFMLLATGELVYFGPWEGAVPFFASAGLHCPQFTNPTDFFMHELQDPVNVQTLAEQQRRKGITGASGADEESTFEQAAVPALETVQDQKESTVADNPEVPAYYQTFILTIRNYRNYFRNPVMFFSETAQYAFMGLFVGLMYFNLNNSIETGVNDRLASLWFGMAVLSFTPSYTAVTIWDRERVLLRREAGQAMYRVSSWFAARTLLTVPMQILQVLLFGLIAFYMTGLANTASNVLIYLASYGLFQITSESIGVLCAAVTKSSTTAVLVLTFVLLLLLSFSGFLVSDVPVYFKWVGIISYLTYAYDAVVVSEFGSMSFNCTTGPPTCAETGLIVPGSELVPSNTDNGLKPGYNLLILLAITIGTRFLCFVTIFAAYKLHFL